MEPSAFILLWIMAINSVSAEGCGAQSCCWLKIPNDYCGITLPKIAVESPMDIAARFMVKNLQEVDEAKLSYIIDIKIVLIWQDNRFVDGNFTEDEALNCFPGMIRPEQVDEVWKPDIFLEGTMDGSGYMGNKMRPGSAIWLNRTTGQFQYWMDEHREMNCNMDFQRYPMDEQICYFKILSGSYGLLKLNFTNSEFIVSEKALEKITKYEVTFEALPSENRTMVAEAVRKSYSVAGFRFRLVRHFRPIFSNTYLPCMMLLLISFIGFFIPVQMVPGRMALLVTIFLMLVNITTSLKATGPRTDTMTAQDTWMLLAMITLCLELFEYAVLLRIRFSNAAPDYRWKRGWTAKKRVSGTLSKKSVAPRCPPGSMPARLPMESEDNCESEETVIVAKCRTIDWWAFWGFLLGSAFVNFVFFIYFL